VESRACADIAIDHPRFDASGAILDVDGDDAIHARQTDHHWSRDRQTASREAGAGAAWNEADAVAVAEPDDRRHLAGRTRQHD
jgi:hypothetical protein